MNAGHVPAGKGQAVHCESSEKLLGETTSNSIALLISGEIAAGRTGLFLSGGAARGFYHLGVVKALAEQRLVPRVISGASAGQQRLLEVAPGAKL